MKIRKSKEIKEKVKTLIYKKYIPTSDWFKLNRENNIQGSNRIDIQKMVNKLKNFYYFTPEGKLFDESHSFKEICYDENIEIKKKYLPIINHPLMVRLLDLKQLSLTYRIHVSATHNRFSHSIGTYKRMGQLIKQLKKYEATKKFISKNEDVLYIYALIHDIGHTPFSHSLEYVFNLSDKTILKDILEHNNDLKNIITAAIARTDFEYEDFLKITTVPDEDLEGMETLLRKTIDSPIDADRMDWLYRDVLLCKGDIIMSRINHIIANTIPYKNPTDSWILVYPREPLTISNLTEFLHTRHQMYTEVYEHPRKVILEELIARIMYEIFLNNGITVDQLKFLTDGMVINIIKMFSNLQQDQLLRKALFGNNYEMIETLSVKQSEKEEYNPWGLDIKNNLGERIKIEKKICKDCQLNEDNAFIVHFPRKFISGAEDIWLLDKDNSMHRLCDESYFKGLKELDKDNAQHIQLFLQKTGITNFEAKKKQVIETFNARVRTISSKNE